MTLPRSTIGDLAQRLILNMNWQKQVAEFKADLKVEPSVISTQAIRFGFFGLVGGGKSVTAGIFAVGITPTGKIGWIDGEGKRSGWATDVVASMAASKYGGTQDDWKKRFTVIHIDPPFHPLRVVAAIELLEEQGCATVVLDILSAAWDSDGGYLDLKAEELDRMAGDDDRKRERSAASAAAHIKPWTHQKLVNKVNTSKCNLVLLFQAKQKYNAKSFKPDDFVTPIQESGLTRTAIAVGRVESNEQGEGGYCSFQLPPSQGTKYTHASILKALPQNGQQFKFEHAEAIARLCGMKVGTPPKPPEDREKAEMKRKLWKLTEPLHKGNTQALEQWLIDEKIFYDNEKLADLSAKRLLEVIEDTENKLREKMS